MANVVITLKVMPEGVDTNLEDLKKAVNSKIKKFSGGDSRIEIEPVAFGLKALKFTFVSDEKKGGTDELENQIINIEGVNSVDVIDVRRALG